MTLSQVLIALLTWLIVSAIGPLIVNSVERLYQREIDRTVSRAVAFLVSAFWRAIQVTLVTIMAPTILLVLALKGANYVAGRDVGRTRYKVVNDTVAGVSFVLSRDFPNVARSVLKEARGQKQP